MSESTNKQVKSKQRVADHGEVFTAEREVNAMLDLVKQQTENIDSTFLEPACGNGNFLAEILRRKLAIVNKENVKSKGCLTDSWEMDSVHAIMSIYGVDLLQDNVEECRERLFNIWNEAYTKACKKACREQCREIIRFVLQRNILCGNALDLCRVDESGNPLYETDANGNLVLGMDGQPKKIPIIFSEWSWTGGSRVTRRDFRLDVLMLENNEPNSYEKIKRPDEGVQMSLFDSDATGYQHWQDEDKSGQKIIPAPVDAYEQTYYLNLKEADHGT